MNRLRTLFAILLILLLSCGKNKNQITLSFTNADAEVPSHGNLSFSFNQVIAPDSIHYTWIEDEYISFNPPIEGQFRWTSASELSFTPNSPLPPATNFTGEFNDALLELNGTFKSTDLPELSFYTTGLKLESANLHWFLNESGATSAKLEMQFNYSVNTADLADKIVLSLNGKDFELDLISDEQSTYASFLLAEFFPEDIDYNFDLTLEKGLIPIGGSNAMPEDVNELLILKSPYQIDILETETDHNGLNGEIIIHTSQEIAFESAKSFIELTPEINYSVSVEENKLILQSEDFDVNTKYILKLNKGLKGVVGGTLNTSYQTELTFGELQPSIEFENSKGMYLSALGNQQIAVRIINVPEVKVKVYKLYESNVLNADLNSSYYYDYYDNSDYYYGEMQKKELLWEKTYQTKDLPKNGSSSLLSFDFKDELAEYKGIYFVQVQSTENYWLKDGKYISKSDLGLIAKKGQNKIHVFVNSLSTAESLKGVKVKAFGRNNQLIAEGFTNADGSLVLNLKNSNFKGFEPALITAAYNKEFSILNLYDGRVETARFDVGGYRDLPNGLQTFIYLERNVYRPGETVHFAAIVRNQSWISPGNLPLRVEIVNPMGKQLNSIKKSLNNEGSLDANFNTELDDPTGLYTIYLYTSNDVLLGSKNVLIEEFMPDRIKVNTSLSQVELTPEITEADLTIEAQNLFGPPAANRNYQVEVSYRNKYFSPKDYTDYSFNIRNTDRYFEIDFWEGKTDAQGKALETISVYDDYANMGVVEATALTTVFDETGRPVNRKDVIDIYTQDLFYGLGHIDYYMATNTALKIPLVVVDKDGKAKSGEQAKVQVIKHEYQTVLNKSSSFFRYESNKVEKVLVDQTITLNGETTFSYTPLVSGEYEVRVYNPEVNGKYVSQGFYAYGYGRTYLSSFEVDNEGRIDIELDKQVYAPGEIAKILFKTPFQGKMLVTVEGEDVLDHFYLTTDKRSAEYAMTIREDYLPNVYITATLFKPHESTEFPLTVAHGFQSISVKDERRNIDIDILSVSESRSNTTQKVTVKGAPNSMVSIAVVDEGILQVGNYSTPDPYNYFYQKRALQVRSADVYPFLLPEISSSNSSGGDEGFNMSKLVNPFQNDRVKLVSFWSGLMKTNSLGEANFEVDIPQFSGSLRIMAVNHKGNAFGSEYKQIIVADPIVISSSIPIFLSPGDTAYISSTFSNTTEDGVNAKTSINATGPLKILGSSTQNLNIEKKAEGRVVYKVYAESALGNGTIEVKSSAFGEVFKETTNITVRPSSPLIKENESGSVGAGEKIVFDNSEGNFLPKTLDRKLVISKNPMLEFAKDLDYLVRYPYGCSEQTVSSVFPQLYYRDLVLALYQKDDQSENIANNISAAINKLKMRQLYNGAIAMWDNCDECENWWVTAYTAHFLIEAEAAGYTIDNDFLNTTLAYLKNRLKNKETVYYNYMRNMSKKIAPKEVPYSLYVLALADQADVSLMNYYKSNTSMLSLDGQYLLSAAYVLAGDLEKGKSILPNSFKSEESARQFGGAFYSPMRDEAIALNALLTVDPNHKDIGVMAKHLSTQLKDGNDSYNTQDRIFSFLALGKLAKQANAAVLDAVIRVDGKQVGSYSEGGLTLYSNDLKGEEISVETSGSGNLFYYFEREGITKDGSYKEEDSHLKVRKTFYDRYGNVIRSYSFKQNDLIVVKLSITSDYGNVSNVVITDMLPAGFEIENPRIDDVPGTQWVKNKSYPDYTDVRDDRINLFDDVKVSNGKTQDYYYVVRAVSPGVYKMGPVAASAMYNGEYHSYHGAGWITITE